MKEIMDRFIEWVNKHGGPTPVAVAIGKSPQSFYNYTNRGSKPNMEIFALLANAFPDFETDFILTGRKKSSAVIEEEFKELEAKYKVLQSMYERAVVEKATSLGKSEDATLCPDVQIYGRKHQFKDAMKSIRSRRSKVRMSDRVQGAIVDPLRELYDRLT